MKNKDLLLYITITIICSLVMLPRILSPQFGLLDDGLLLLNAEHSLTDASSILYKFGAAGRFLPTALLFRMFFFTLAGFDPQLWYILSGIILIIICFELALIAHRYGLNRLQTLFGVLFFVVSPTLIENFYTLSKSEIPLLLLIAGAIVIATAHDSTDNLFKKILIAILCFFLLLFSFGAKETAIVLPILFLSWLAISWVFHKKTGKYRSFMQSDLILLAGSLIACVLYWTVRSSLGVGNLSSYSAGYQLFNLEKLVFNLKAFLGWLIRDYPYLFLILSWLLLIRPLREPKVYFIALRWLSWMAAWALVLLPWNYLSYYLLPFSFGSALFSGAILGQMLAPLLSKEDQNSETDPQPSFMLRTRYRSWLAGACIASLVLLIPPAFNAKAYATEQLMFDQANWQFVEQAKALPYDSQLFLSLPLKTEYFYQLQIFVSHVYDRPDIKIKPFQSTIQLPREHNVYIAGPVFLHQVLPRVRALNGPDVMVWGQRLRPIVKDSELVYSTRLCKPLFDVGLHRILSFLEIGDMIGYSNRTVFTETTMVYGWDLWKYSPLK